MKKKILFTVIFAVMSFSAFTQIQYGLGVIGDLSLDFANVSDSSKLSDANQTNIPALGWGGGIKTVAIFNPFIALEFDVLFNRMGYNSLYAPPASSGEENTISIYTGSSIELNLLARPQIPFLSGAIYGLVGVGYQSELGQARKFTASGSQVFDTTQVNVKTVVNSVPYQILTLPVGLGVTGSVGPGMMSFDVRYNIPLTVLSANKKDASSEDLATSIWTDPTADANNGVTPMIKLSNIKFMMGYTYFF